MSNSQAVTMVGNSIVHNKEANQLKRPSVLAVECRIQNSSFWRFESPRCIDSIFRYNLHARALIRQLGKSP